MPVKLGIVAAIHGNDVALRAVLADGQQLGVARWWALGDLVLFGPRPAEVLEIVLPGWRDCAPVILPYQVTQDELAPASYPRRPPGWPRSDRNANCRRAGG